MEWIKYSLVYTADSKIRFEIESDGRFDSKFDSNAKNDSQVPSFIIFGIRTKRYTKNCHQMREKCIKGTINTRRLRYKNILNVG